MLFHQNSNFYKGYSFLISGTDLSDSCWRITRFYDEPATFHELMKNQFYWTMTFKFSLFTILHFTAKLIWFIAYVQSNIESSAINIIPIAPVFLV